MIKEKITIKETDIRDIYILSGIIRKSYQDVAKKFHLTAENCPRHPSNCTDEWIQNDFSRGVIYYILMHEDDALGCVAIEQPEPELCYLERLCVLPEYRRNGLGKILVDHAFKQAEAINVKKIGIGIISKQTELKKWYEKAGFVEGDTKNFPHLPFSVTFMTYEFQ